MLSFALRVRNLAARMGPAAASALLTAPRKVQREILAAYKQFPDSKGKCGLEISTPCGTGPRRR